MDMLAYRILLLVSFVAYMAAIYVALHIIVARFSRGPESRLLWFFSVLTGPLTRAVRRVVPDAMTESQVRYFALGVCICIWLGTRLVLVSLSGVGQIGGE
jgi:hypothetical protein